MGIPGLLPFMKRACRQGNIEEFAGQTVAVDTSCWLHKGVFGCMDRIAQGHDTDMYLNYVLKRVALLRRHNCRVILVFDGRPLPSKASTNNERRERRLECKARGQQLLREGRKSEAAEVFRSATEVTWEVVSKVIQRCRLVDGVDCLVSPYESDAQLAFLQRRGMAQAVITEDSDLIPFGCHTILFKMSVDCGSCVVYDQSQAHLCFGRGLKDEFSVEKLRRSCILAGCDYIDRATALSGVGLTKAAKFFGMTSATDIRQALKRVPRYLNMSKLTVTPDFIEAFVRAENTFLYQLVCNPQTRQLRPLTGYPDKTDHKDYPYAGAWIQTDILQEIVGGNRDPASVETATTKVRQALKPLDTSSIWHPFYQAGGNVSRPAKKNPEKAAVTSLRCFEVAEAKRCSSDCGDSDRKRKASDVIEARQRERHLFSLYASASAPEIRAEDNGSTADNVPQPTTSKYFDSASPDLPPLATVTRDASPIRPVLNKARNPFKNPCRTGLIIDTVVGVESETTVSDQKSPESDSLSSPACEILKQPRGFRVSGLSRVKSPTNGFVCPQRTDVSQLLNRFKYDAAGN